ncbi:hypothetical protein R1flu_011803 [Riccia fluitans]|uniref:histidine kinase n=1 Tax=Riccia fluitans TaxID=41844 RepID=A0ABD1Z8T8_9MARC
MHTCVGAQGLCFSTCLSLCHGLGVTTESSLSKDSTSSIPVGLILASVCGVILGRYSLGFFQVLHYLRPWRSRKWINSSGVVSNATESTLASEDEEWYEECCTTTSTTENANCSSTKGGRKIDSLLTKKAARESSHIMQQGMQQLPFLKWVSKTSDSRTAKRVQASKRSGDFDEKLGMAYGSKRLSPERNSSSSYLSSTSPLGSNAGLDYSTCISCGSPCGHQRMSSGLEADVDYMGLDMDSDYRVEDPFDEKCLHLSKESPLSFEDIMEYAKGLHGTVSPLLETPAHCRPPRDELGLNFLNGRISAAAWMCGGDAASLKLECGLGWLDLVKPCLDDVYGQQWEVKAHPEDLERCKAVFAEAKAKRAPFQVEYRLQVSPNDYRWVMDLAKPRFSRSRGNFLGYVGWRIDIHEQKSIEYDMEKYWSLPHEILVKAAPDGKCFENVSPSLTNRLGYTQEEFLSTEWMSLLHPDDREYTMSEFQKVALGQPIVNLQNRYRCKDGAKVEGPTFVDSTGTYKWFNWTANYMYGAGRDISAEKVVQEELRRSQAELRRITDAIPGGVFQYRIDEKGVETFPFVSKGALSMCSSQESIEDGTAESAHYNVSSNQPFKESGLIHADDLPTLTEALRQSSLSHTNLDCDYRIVRNGEVRWVRVHAVPQTRGEDGTKEWCGLTWDITERHLVEEALRQARDVAEKSSEAKGKFLANMSHEIRTPMNAVIGMGALLLETDLNEEQREYVSTIRSSGEALLAVINDILDFSKIEAGKMDLEVAPFSLTDCIEDSLDLISSQAASKGLELTYTVTEKVPSMLKGDVSRVRQILVNLLSNAMKFTDHGQVSIAVDGRKLDGFPASKSVEEERTWLASATAPIKLKQGGAKWEIQISVKDTGIGIPDDRIHTLFQAFRQVDASTTRKYGGTGLGLAICAHLCALWGGRIWVDSVPGEGSTFHFTINGEEIIEEETRDDEEDYVMFLRKKRVLVIAGSSSSGQTMCTRFLKSWQVRVVSAVTGDEALQVVRQTLDHAKDGQHSCSCRHAESSSLNDTFTAVIVDCAMIDEDNERVLESLKLCQTSTPRIPIILLTPFARRIQDYIQELDIRFTAHVSKPVKASHLLRSLMNAVIDEKDEMMSDRTDFERGKELGLKKWKKRMSSGTPVSMDIDTGKRYPLRILVAEDNAINQKVLLRLLQRHGYTADVVGNGLEAVDAASRQSYDVCLMDCFMPEMDGLEATKRIRQIIKPCPVIVAVTAAALEEEKKGCLEAGMHMYIAKPIKAEQLIRTLYKCWQVKTREVSVESLQQEILSAPTSQKKY